MARYSALIGILVIVGCVSIAWAEITDMCVEQCKTNYPHPANRTSPCCGCCGMDQACFENAATTVCCKSTQGFCGCLNEEGFCSGMVNDVISPNLFGICYDLDEPRTSICCYNPTASSWILCPVNTTCCASATSYSCCGPDTVCATGPNDITPQCMPIVSIPPPIMSTGSPISSTGSVPPISSTGSVPPIMSTGSVPPISSTGSVPPIMSTGSVPPIMSTASPISSTGSVPPVLSTGSVPVLTESIQTTGEVPPLMTTAAVGTGPITVPTPGMTSSVPVDVLCSLVSCMEEEQCCGGQCYLPILYTCLIDPRNNKETLCQIGMQLCGPACYNPADYTCNFSDGYYYLEPILPPGTQGKR